MEADWSVEISPDLPVIDAAWGGFVDLRNSPEKIDEIEEARRCPAMRESLSSLNSLDSPLFTTKCDCWNLTGGEIDPDEFAASRGTACAGLASYIDVVYRNPTQAASFKIHERWGREITSALRAINLQQGRVDVVVRAAVVEPGGGFGLTLYAAGCGTDFNSAVDAWERILVATVAATITAARASSSIG